MIPRSVRWRLPLSYAGIALLAAVSLGVVLLLQLQGYYARQEQQFLAGNAMAISAIIESVIGEGAPPSVVASYFDNLAFLAQARVRLFDAGGQLIAESGSPGAYGVSLGAAPVGERALVEPDGRDPDPETIMRVVPLTPAPGTARADFPLSPRVPLSGERTLQAWGDGMPGERVPRELWVTTERLDAVSTVFGLGLNADLARANERSSQVMRTSVHDTGGELLGYLELSEGPAYGREVLNSVVRGWALAGAVAVLLAAGAGWFASRRISAPLLALTTVTAAMAEGDLSARADIDRRDEFGALADSFNRMAGRVQGTVVTLRQFVSDAAHEIHTPLTALRTNLELAPQDEFVAQAQAQVARLEGLTRGLLDLSRIEARDLSGTRVPVDLVPLVRGIAEAYASQAEQAGLSFELAAPESPVVVSGEPDQLRRAVANLLDNAVKFTPPGGTVTTGLRWEGERVELRVEDTGIGIPADDLPDVFSRFHRGRNATVYPGSGLGLAIVKATAEAHGGGVSAENTADGARFTLWLPAGQDA